MTRPSCLCLAHGGDDAWEFRPLQHLSVGDLVLPADFENAAKTSEMKLLMVLFMSPVNGPGFTAVEKCCQDDCSLLYCRGGQQVDRDRQVDRRVSAGRSRLILH